MPKTFVVPLQLNIDGSFGVTEDPARIVRQRIIDLLATSKWERTMRPNHGCDLKGFLFTQVIDHLLATKANEVKTTVNAGITFGEVISVNMTLIPGTESAVQVAVQYVVFEGGNVETLTETFTGLPTDEIMGELEELTA